MTQPTHSNAYDTLIIGGGVAGLSAGLYAARDGFRTVVLEGDYISNTIIPGGALQLTPEIENFPGFQSSTGEALIITIRTQAETFGAELRDGYVKSVSFNQPDGFHHVTLTTGETLTSRTVIVATGAASRLLNVGEETLLGEGVSTCATCDGFFFQQKKVAVIGGGDTAVEDSIFLKQYTPNVSLIVRRDKLRATGPDARLAEQMNEDTTLDYNIRWETSVSKIRKDEDGLILTLRHNGQDTDERFDGVFIAVGRDPLTGFLKDSPIELDDEGYIKTIPDSTRVAGKVQGVFAAGDNTDKVFRQAITSAGKGVEAALEARHYLQALSRAQSLLSSHRS